MRVSVGYTTISREWYANLNELSGRLSTLNVLLFGAEKHSLQLLISCSFSSETFNSSKVIVYSDKNSFKKEQL